MSAVVLPDEVVDAQEAARASLVDDVVAAARSVLPGNRVVLVSDFRWIVRGAMLAMRPAIDARRAQEPISRAVDPSPSPRARRAGAGRRTRRRRR